MLKNWVLGMCLVFIGIIFLCLNRCYIHKAENTPGLLCCNSPATVGLKWEGLGAEYVGTTDRGGVLPRTWKRDSMYQSGGNGVFPGAALAHAGLRKRHQT